MNGTGEFGFLLTATDGDAKGGGGVDKFRIKIWDKETGNTVYDNAPGASTDSTPPARSRSAAEASSSRAPSNLLPSSNAGARDESPYLFAADVRPLPLAFCNHSQGSWSLLVAPRRG